MTIQRLKQLTLATTETILAIGQDLPAQYEQCHFPPELQDDPAAREICMQKSMLKLLELNMMMREELILLGVSYEKKTTETQSYHPQEGDH